MAGKTNLEAAQADEIVDTISDVTEKLYDAFLFEGPIGNILHDLQRRQPHYFTKSVPRPVRNKGFAE